MLTPSLIHSLTLTTAVASWYECKFECEFECECGGRAGARAGAWVKGEGVGLGGGGWGGGINDTFHQHNITPSLESIRTYGYYYSTPRQNIVSLSTRFYYFVSTFLFVVLASVGCRVKRRQGGGKEEARGRQGGGKEGERREKNKTISIHLGQKFTHKERGFLPTILQRILSWWD